MSEKNDMYITANEARSISKVGEEDKIRKQCEFNGISDEEFENAVREFTATCLERYIEEHAKNGDNHELIVPAHYKTADDDQNRINRAKEIVEDMVSPYGYTVSWFCGTNIISINW